MDNPFIFGKAVEGPYFTDRQEDAKRLRANLCHGINTILISPRRWGKTSLVKKVTAEIESKNLKTVFIDVFSAKSEYEFFRTFATEVVKQTSSKIDEWIETAKVFLSNISPKFSFGSDPMNDFSLSFEWNERDDTEKEILQLPEKIAEKKGIRVVVCLDEFQQVAFFGDQLTFQKKLRTVWQHQQHVTYCLFGSKKHLMTTLFCDASYPFYKFGDIMFIDKIPEQEWVEYICHQFAATGKSISQDLAALICKYAECQSSYVQHLSWIAWYKTEGQADKDTIDSALSDLLKQNSVFFQRDVESLTSLQLNFIKALADGVETGFSKKEYIRKYNLESSANIQAVKKALISKEYIETDNDRIYISDPMFKIWVKHHC